ncbi:putative glyoxylate/hydroxypyruvate reductase A HPR2 [Apostichopus japonicus]|uniref:Putative glyoxylate/hydroxypyruvate reductase A HPR2 n=1 Tax=Stichopus japonicus TaxID=307972 RepID=A0A2G8LCE9_STIJA|nr:putative glyoxylate/hydroxypyruvate reductase A HPR2 [Apostichopus japonicus]
MVEKLPKVVICSSLIIRVNGERSMFENLLLQSYSSISVCFEMKINPETFAEDLKSAEIIVADAKDFYQLLPFAPNLKWFQVSSAGVNLIMEKVNRSEGTPQYPFTVTRMGGTYHSAIAEYVIAQIISRERQFEKMREEQKIKCWDRKYRTYRILKELTIGIIGAGDIGVEVARCCKCFDMKTIGLCKQDRPKEQRSQYIDVSL